MGYEKVAEANRKRMKHGGAVNARQGGASKTYKVWTGIKQRCLNPKTQHYARYGGRGITMHKAWADDYAEFVKDVGEQPEGMTLERIDNDGNYEPNNVRWSTRKEQANNRVTNVYVEWQGETKTLAQWADHLGWKYGLLGSRWKQGLRGDELFEPPKRSRNQEVTFNGRTMTLTEWSMRTGVSYFTLHWRHKNGKPLL